MGQERQERLNPTLAVHASIAMIDAHRKAASDKNISFAIPSNVSSELDEDSFGSSLMLQRAYDLRFPGFKSHRAVRVSR